MGTPLPAPLTYSVLALYKSSPKIASRIQLLVQEAFLLKVSNHLPRHVTKWGAYTVHFLDLNLQENQESQTIVVVDHK